MKQYKTICHALVHSQNRPDSPVAYQVCQGKTIEKITWKESYETTKALGNALLSFGIQKGDRVSILANTRYEWAAADLAILGVGAITVPIYQSSRSDEVEFILNHAEPKVLFCENLKQLKKWQEIQVNCPSVEKVIVIDRFSSDFTELDWKQALEIGRQYGLNHSNQFEELCSQRVLDDLATVVYTSGTTGDPKGVLLTHKQIKAEIEYTLGFVGMGPGENSLSFLPYAHVLGRLEHWGQLFCGCTISFAESIEKIPANLQMVKPTFLMAVPRIFEKFYSTIEQKFNQKTAMKLLFEWAKNLAIKNSQNITGVRSTTLFEKAQIQLAKKIVLDKIYQGLGGNFKFVISGGAPLNSTLGQFFHGCGVLILEGYGLSETTGAVFCNLPDDYRFGTVGKALGNIEVKIAADGEILLRGDMVMKEYYKNPEATNEVFESGYFKTGDIGHLDDKGFLVITDRKKDLIKTAGGKYVAPQKLEGLIKLNPYVSNVLIHGDKRKYVVCLVTLQEPAIKKMVNQLTLDDKNDFEKLIEADPIQNLIRDHIKKINKDLASYETIKKFKILSSDFTIESGELTPSLKVKRKFCDEKYASVLDGLYH